MKKLILAFTLLSLSLFGQTNDNGRKFIGVTDASSSTTSKPFREVTGIDPTTCTGTEWIYNTTTGHLFSCASSVTVLYTPKGTWTQIPAISCTPTCVTGTSQIVVGTATATATFSSIPSTYTSLKIIASLRTSGGSAFNGVVMQFNGDTANHYSYQNISIGTGTSLTTSATINTSSSLIGNFPGTTTLSNWPGVVEVTLHNYANTTFNKLGLAISQQESGTSTLIPFGEYDTIEWASTAAINSVSIFTSATFLTGSTFTLYVLP